MRRLAVPLVLVALVAPAEASAYTPPPVEYTAAISGTDAFVGIVKRGDRFRAYLSDATAQRVTLSVWFRGASARTATWPPRRTGLVSRRISGAGRPAAR
jgi:hypothetical protein